MWLKRISKFTFALKKRFNTSDQKTLGRWVSAKYNPESKEYYKRERIEKNLSHQGNTQHCGDDLCGDPLSASINNNKIKE